MRIEDSRKLAAYVGDTYALFGMKEYYFAEGRAKGIRGIDLKNGQGLDLTILPDRCMDIPYLSYKGCNIGFVSKTGLSAPQYFREDGTRGFLKQFNGGFLTTCGITYSGTPDEKNGRKYGLHGIISNTPAENVNKEIINVDGQAVMRVTGTMREASVFEEFIKLHREILIETETNTIHIHDVVENCGFEEQPLMSVYHLNFGYPMLNEHCLVYTGADNVIPRDEEAQKGISRFFVMEAPSAGYKEQCFFHIYKKASEGAFAMIHNEAKGLAVIIHYDVLQCPVLCEWKSMQSGDYALGLEPTAAGVLGKEKAEEEGILKYLKPGERQKYDIRVEVLEDMEEIRAYINADDQGK